MKSIRQRHMILLAFSIILLEVSRSPAQEQATPQDNSSKPVSPKELKKRQKQLSKELDLEGGIWLNDEVPDIITPDERRAFLELSTNEERDQFRELFWQRRNPDPDSPINTAKEEHYRRLAYADEHFSSGIPGRKTDRGRIYIIWGQPDEIESHPMGGAYQRPWSRAEANPAPILGNSGAIGICRGLARISKSNS